VWKLTLIIYTMYFTQGMLWSLTQMVTVIITLIGSLITLTLVTRPYQKLNIDQPY